VRGREQRRAKGGKDARSPMEKKAVNEIGCGGDEYNESI
jgi:hypothetical protein